MSIFYDVDLDISINLIGRVFIIGRQFFCNIM